MIPEFPEFKDLDLSDKEEITHLTRQFPPNSDFHFISVYCWDIDKKTQISRLNENLIVRQINCLNDEMYFSLIGLNNVPLTVEAISKFLKQKQLPLTLRWVPEETVKCLNGISAKVSEDRDYFDYIFNIEDLYHAKGRKYKSYRHDIAKFKRLYPHVNSKFIDLTNSEIGNQINKLFKSWAEKRNEYLDGDSVTEEKALNKLIASAVEFKTLVAIGVYDNLEMIAFSIEDLSTSEYGFALFWKANTNYIGLYDFLQNEATNLHYSKGIKFVNWENDLGIESLRASKLRHKPAFFLKKYKIEIDN